MNYTNIEQVEKAYARGDIDLHEMNRWLVRFGRPTRVLKEENAQRLAEENAAEGLARTAGTFERALRFERCEDQEAAEHAAEFLRKEHNLDVVATVDSKGHWGIELPKDQLMIRSAHGISTVRNQDGWEILAMADLGPLIKVEEDEGRRTRNLDNLSLQVLRSDLGAEISNQDLLAAITHEVCTYCGRKEGLSSRRYKAGVRKPDGSIVALGSTCFAKAFGVPMSEAWPRREIDVRGRRIINWAIQEGAAEARRLRDEERGRRERASLDRALPEGVTADDCQVVFEKLVEEGNVETGWVVNTLSSLRLNALVFVSQHDTRTLSRWGRQMLSRYRQETGAEEPVRTIIASPSRRPVDPGIQEGDVVTVEAEVIRTYWHRGRYGPERRVTLRDASGWKFWFRCQDESLSEGLHIRFTAECTGQGDRGGIHFFKTPSEIAGVTTTDQAA